MLQRERNNKLMTFEAIVAAIGHEIKQPLAAIELNASSAPLFLDQSPPNIEEVRSILEEVKHDGHRIGETLDGIRSLFGKVDQRRQLTNLNDIVIEALRSSNAEMKTHAVTARTRLATDLPVFFGAPNQLHQAVFNLVHNGIEAMRSTTDRARILEVRTEYRNDAICVEVSDTGPGIDQARLPDIFEAFVTTKPQGMGLGLAICRMIVERHKGQLSAAPAQPHGTIFRIVLPSTSRIASKS
jgi:signal transduction histidine kinase